MDWVDYTANASWYWSLVNRTAKKLGANGCTGVPDFYRQACLEHDIHYRTHLSVFGSPITKATADRTFRRRIQQRSIFGILSPMAWWRWLAVRFFGGKAWKGDKN